MPQQTGFHFGPAPSVTPDPTGNSLKNAVSRFVRQFTILFQPVGPVINDPDDPRKAPASW